MFKLNTERTFKRDVVVYIPNDEGGFTKGSFIAHFKVLPENEILALEDEPDASVLDKVLKRVEGITDVDGNNIGEDVALAGVKNDTLASAAALREYAAATKGKNLKRKN